MNIYSVLPQTHTATKDAFATDTNAAYSVALPAVGWKWAKYFVQVCLAFMGT